MKNPAIELHDVTLSYQGRPILWDVDFQIPPGKLVAIAGRNGAGKSSLLKCMMGLLPRQSGEVFFFGEPLGKRSGTIAYVPQRQNIDWNFPILVQDVVMMGRYPHMGFLKRPSAVDHAQVTEALKAVGLDAVRERPIGELSTGQQQRVFVARMLAQDASICLLDEPFAGVDATTTKELFQLLQRCTQAGKTMLLVHHTLRDIRSYCDHTLLLNSYLVASGPTEEVLTAGNIERAYQDREGILDQVRQLVADQELPVREAP